MKIASGRSVDLVNDKDKVELLCLAWPASTGDFFPAGVIDWMPAVVLAPRQ